VVRGALADTGGLRGTTAAHVERILDLSAGPAPSGRRLPLPGGREASFRFGEVAIGPRSSRAVPFDLPLSVPGRVPLPGGGWLEARTPESGWPSTPEGDVEGREVVVSAPADRPLAVRTRRPGDRVRRRGRRISLKRFLMDGRVPAEARDGLPLVAAGDDVLWVAGQAVCSFEGDETRRLVALRLIDGHEDDRPESRPVVGLEDERESSRGAGRKTPCARELWRPEL
jgi:tRNA(Ile)-lysidine synthase